MNFALKPDTFPFILKYMYLLLRMLDLFIQTNILLCIEAGWSYNSIHQIYLKVSDMVFCTFSRDKPSLSEEKNLNVQALNLECFLHP